jgi:hypothetical protein
MQDGPISVIPSGYTVGAGLPVVVALRLPPASFLNPFGIKTSAMKVAHYHMAQFSLMPRLRERIARLKQIPLRLSFSNGAHDALCALALICY